MNKEVQPVEGLRRILYHLSSERRKNTIAWVVGPFRCVFNFSDYNKSTIALSRKTFVYFGFWSIKAVVEIKAARDTQIERQVTFSVINTTHEFDITSLGVTDEEQIVVHIDYKEVSGFNIHRRPFSFVQMGPKTDVCLNVRGKKFYQNKKLLSYYSPVLKNIMKKRTSANKTEYDIDLDKSYSVLDFEFLLDATYGSHLFNYESAVTIVKLADFYDIQAAKKRAEDHLIDNSSGPAADKLLLAGVYRLARLQHAILSEWTVSDAGAIVNDQVETYKDISYAAIQAILKKTYRL